MEKRGWVRRNYETGYYELTESGKQLVIDEDKKISD
jgi:DNA-binding PadR family transcriptional regulator